MTQPRGEPVKGPEPAGPLTTSSAARLETAELMEVAARAFRVRCSQDGVLATVGAELDRREGWRATGATSLAGWLVQQLGVCDATARAYSEVAEHVSEWPHLGAGLSEGRLNLDKVRSLIGVATPETEAEWAEAAEGLSFKDLGALVRSKKRPTRPSDRKDHEKRSLRFNDAHRTIVAQLPPVPYAEVRAALEARVKGMGSDGETPLDQRLADALVSLLRSGGGASSSRVPFVVAHVPFEAWHDPDSELPGELERGGLISADVVRRLLCDADVVVALDDEEGHTMYEGRARRYPSPAQRREVFRRDRHCVFPGCANVLFTNCHHLDTWEEGGRSDLDNLALLCEHHHHLIHQKAWSMSGDANVEVRFVGPTGQVMTTRPSRLWNQVTDPKVMAERRAGAGRGDGNGESPNPTEEVSDSGGVDRGG
jgi:uncharacterized protein DUF222